MASTSAPTAGVDRAERRHRGSALAVVALLAVTAAIRLPALLAARHLTFDDGVFGASAVAMRHGGVPFRDVFSSQGPLFLPLVWAADILGLRTLSAPRLVGLLAGILLVAAVYVASRQLTTSRRSLAAAALVGITGSVIWVTAPVASDGPALALATAAVACALLLRRHPTLGLAAATGALLGAGLAVKSLVIPAALPVALVLIGHAARRRPQLLAVALASAVAVGFIATLPWGFGDVWDQSVDYHLDAARRRTPVANAAKMMSTLGDRDLPLLAVGIATLGWIGLRRRSRIPSTDAPVDRSRADLPAWAHRPEVLLGAWLAGIVAVLLLEHPLWRPHVAHLAPPLALLLARHLPPTEVLLVAVAAVLPWHLAHNEGVLWPGGYTGPEARAVADLELLPEGAVAISDDPGLVWRAGLRTPPDLVDTSFLRIDSGRLTPSSLAAQAASPDVCAVLVWSPRHFGGFASLPERLAASGFEPSARYGDGNGDGDDKVLYLDQSCQALDGGG